MAYRRAYVGMVLKVDPNGSFCPLQVIWEDGKHYPVDEVRNVTPAAQTEAGGPGFRYTLVIRRRERYFYENAGRWFTWVVAPSTDNKGGSR